MTKFIEVKSKSWGLIVINIELIEHIHQKEDGCITVYFPSGWIEFLYSKEEF